jgi:hypothetical protein
MEFEIRLDLTLTLSSRRGDSMTLHWKKSLHNSPAPWQERLLPLLGERAGVREIVVSLLHG